MEQQSASVRTGRPITVPKKGGLARQWLLGTVLCSAAAIGLLLQADSPAIAGSSPRMPISVNGTRGAMLHVHEDPQISSFLWSIAQDAIRRFRADDLTPANLSIALILDGDNPAIGGYHMDRSFYPASVVKLCYAAALEKDFATGKITRSSSVLDDLNMMLTQSSNAATNRIVDLLTDTESGPNLPADQLAAFSQKRQAVNTYMRQLGFKHINACQKTWDTSPFGRDTQFLGADYKNRNLMTADETARLLWLIKHHKVVSQDACDEILGYIHRTPGNPKDIQARRIGVGIPMSSGLWSKAGWTDNANHDAAYVRLPIGGSFVLVVFTNTSYTHPEIISWIASRVTSGVQLDLITPHPAGAQPRGMPSGSKGAK